MPNLVNRLLVQDLSRDVVLAEGMALVTWGGLNAVQNEGLRDKLAEKGAGMMLVRGKLLRIALRERGLELSQDVVAGQVAVAYGSTEATIHAMRILTSEEAKKTGKIAVRGGVIEGRFIAGKEAEAIADLPDRHTLNGQVVSLLASGPRGVVSVLNAVPSALVRVLQARADQLEKASGAAS